MAFWSKGKYGNAVRLGVAVLAIVLAHVLDPWVFTHVRMANIYSRDWGRALRVLGFLPLWWIVALVIWLETPTAMGKWRARLLAVAPTLSGLLGEVCKLLLRRERPDAHAGAYVFRSFHERTWSTSGLALPSSHAIVAFGACFALARMYPRARVVWWALAIGCALSRVAAGAHFLSDVVVAAVLAWIAVAALTRWWRAPANAERHP